MADVKYWKGRVSQKEKEYGLPAGVLHAIISRESGYDPTARGPTNDLGIAQFIPGTARTYGLRIGGGVDDRLDPEKSLDASARLVRDLYKKAGNNWEQIGIGYNAGSGRIGAPRSAVPKGALSYGAYMAAKQKGGGSVPEPTNADAGYAASVMGNKYGTAAAPAIPYVPPAPVQNDALITLQDGIIKPVDYALYQPPEVRLTAGVKFFEPDYKSLNTAVKQWSTF